MPDLPHTQPDRSELLKMIYELQEAFDDVNSRRKLQLLNPAAPASEMPDKSCTAAKDQGG